MPDMSTQMQQFTLNSLKLWSLTRACSQIEVLRNKHVQHVRMSMLRNHLSNHPTIKFYAVCNLESVIK